MLSSSAGLLILDLIRALRAERSALGVPGGVEASEAEHQEAAPETTSRWDAPTDRRESGGSRSAAPASAPQEAGTSPAAPDVNDVVVVQRTRGMYCVAIDTSREDSAVFWSTHRDKCELLASELRTALSRLLADARAKALDDAAKACETWGRVNFDEYPEQGLAAESCARRIRALAARSDKEVT